MTVILPATGIYIEEILFRQWVLFILHILNAIFGRIIIRHDAIHIVNLISTIAVAVGYESGVLDDIMTITGELTVVTAAVQPEVYHLKVVTAVYPVVLRVAHLMVPAMVPGEAAEVEAVEVIGVPPHHQKTRKKKSQNPTHNHAKLTVTRETTSLHLLW